MLTPVFELYNTPQSDTRKIHIEFELDMDPISSDDFDNVMFLKLLWHIGI